MLKQPAGDDAVRITPATKGESYAHRRWPHDVVRAFAAAELATAERAGHDPWAHRVGRRVRRIRARLRSSHFKVRGRGAAGVAATD